MRRNKNGSLAPFLLRIKHTKLPLAHPCARIFQKKLAEVARNLRTENPSLDFQIRTRIFILKILSFLCSHIRVREFSKKIWPMLPETFELKILPWIFRFVREFSSRKFSLSFIRTSLCEIFSKKFGRSCRKAKNFSNIYTGEFFPQNYVFGEFYGKNETIQNVEPAP